MDRHPDRLDCRGRHRALIAGLVPGTRYGVLVPPVLALAVVLIAGFRGSSLCGYRDMSRETFIVSVLLALGFLPAWVAEGRFASGVFSTGALFLVGMLLLIPWIALMAGVLSHRREGWRDTRPPPLLVLGAVAVPVLLAIGIGSGFTEEGRGLSGIYLILLIALMVAATLVALPAAVFLLGRTAITWLQPRLRVYGYLADYLHVMWVPIERVRGRRPDDHRPVRRVLWNAGALSTRRVCRRRRRDHRMVVLRVLHRARPRLHDHRPGYGRCKGARRRQLDPLCGLGGRVVRGGDVIHRAEAGPDRSTPRGGKRRLTGGRGEGERGIPGLCMHVGDRAVPGRGVSPSPHFSPGRLSASKSSWVSLV